MDPPAITSAPDAIDPTTVTSPPGKITDCPDRMGASSKSDVGSSREGSAGAGLWGDTDDSSTLELRPPFNSGGNPGPSREGSTPSSPTTPISRLANSCTKWAIA